MPWNFAVLSRRLGELSNDHGAAKNMRTRFLSRVTATLLLAGAVLVAALLVGLTAVVPRASLFLWIVPTTFLVVLAALVLTCRKPGSYRE
jgi:hypothetical protein